MFNLFGKKNKGPAKPIYTDDNPLFNRLPLEGTFKEELFEHIRAQIGEKVDEAVAQELIQIQTEHPENITHHKRLQFDNFNWAKVDAQMGLKVYAHEKTGNYIMASQSLPSGDLSNYNMEEELLIYQSWIREQFVHAGGALLACNILNQGDIVGYETLARVPTEGQEGNTFMYLLSLQNEQDGKLEQLRLTMRELGGAGLRDQLVRDALLAHYGEKEQDLVYKYFRKDPIEGTYGDGEVMSFAELEVFDELFPFHPLAAMRQNLCPRLLKSLSYLDELPEEEDQGDIEVDFEEL